VGIGVPTTLDAWVELLFKTLRNGAHKILSKEDDDAGNDVPGIYIYSEGTPFSLITKHTKQTVETYKIYIFKKWVCDEGSAKVG
jgi:hypothetical protein